MTEIELYGTLFVNAYLESIWNVGIKKNALES